MTLGTTGLRIAVNEARRALSRGMPVEVLAALDAVSKDSTRRTEDAWYLRAAALLMLGLPGESERVAIDGANAFSGSVALPFLQSLARLALDDTAGARAAVHVASQQCPLDALLLTQQAIISAREGSLVHAAASLSDVLARGGSAPIIAYGRDMLEIERLRMARDEAPMAAGSDGSARLMAPIELGLQLLDASRGSSVSSAAAAAAAGAEAMMDLFPTPHRGSVDAIRGSTSPAHAIGGTGSVAEQNAISLRVEHQAATQAWSGSQERRADMSDAQITTADKSLVAAQQADGTMGRAVEMAAVLLIVDGATAAAAGYAAAAVAFGVGVAWLAIRRAAADGSPGGRSR